MSRRAPKSFASLRSWFTRSTSRRKRQSVCPPGLREWVGIFCANREPQDSRHASNTILALVLTLASVVWLAEKGVAQVQSGTPNWMAYESHAVDTINLANLNVNLNVPVMSKSGAFPFQLAWIGGDSYVYYSSYTNSLLPGYLQAPLTDTVNGFGKGSITATFATTYSGTCPSGYGTGSETFLDNWAIMAADGTRHAVSPAIGVSWSATTTCAAGGFTLQTIDGSGYTLSVTGTTVNSITTRDGGTLNQVTSEFTDSNLNSIGFQTSTGSWTDTLGLPQATFSHPGGDYDYSWGVSGGSVESDLFPQSYTLSSAFGCSTYPDYNIPLNPLPLRISFPDGTDLLLGWEATPGNGTQRTGRISEITLRTGGTINYTYPGTSSNNYGLSCKYLTPTEMTRQTSDGTTTYAIAWQVSGGSCTTTRPCSTTTVVDPGGNKTVYHFSAGWNQYAYSTTPTVVALTEVQKFQNTGTKSLPAYGTAATTDIYCYPTGTTYNTSPSTTCPQAQVILPITTMQVYHSVGASTHPSMQETSYDAYGDVTYSAQFDFGVSTPTFQTTTTYGSWNGSTCTPWSGNVQNKPCEVVKQDGASTPHKLADTRMTYDPYGNLTKTSNFNGSTYIGQIYANTYNSNGTIATSYDVANNETTYAYNAANYFDCVISCSTVNPAFPTTITNVGTGLSIQSTWDILGGVKLSDIGPNVSQTTNYGYNENCGTTVDPFWRIGCVTDPLLYAHGTSYLDTANEVQTAFSFNSGNSVVDTTMTVDSYGRQIDAQKATGPSSGNYDTTSRSYSWPSAFFQTTSTLPCNTTTLGGNCLGSGYNVTTLYDVLNRPTTVTESGNNGVTTYMYYPPNAADAEVDVRVSRGPAPTWDGENPKQAQNRYDGLGRLITACGILSSGGSSCGEANPASGIATGYTYTTTTGSYEVQVARGSQTKTTYSDSLGRPTEVSTPDAGTWLYYYDSSSVPGCPAGYKGSIGALEAAKDANGNLVCHAPLDSLGREIAMNANGTTCRHFYYDATYGTVPE